MGLDLLRPLRGCFVCDSCGDLSDSRGFVRRDGLLKRVENENLVWFNNFYYYHEGCLEEVLNNPQDYGLKKTDKALFIARLIERDRILFEIKTVETHEVLIRLHPEKSKDKQPEEKQTEVQHQEPGKSRYDIAKEEVK